MAVNYKDTSKNGERGARPKYTSLGMEDATKADDVTEMAPLLENMERVCLSAPARGGRRERKIGTTSKEPSQTTSIQSAGKETPHQIKVNPAGSKTVTDDKTEKTPKNDESDKKDTVPDKTEQTVKEPIANKETDSIKDSDTVAKCKDSFVRTEANKEQADDEDDNKLDIVRKMSEAGSGGQLCWQKIGSYRDLKNRVCRRLYAQSGRQDDLALFCHNGRFHAMEAWCSHMGGPLFEGDIENDYTGRCHVMCPWHSYMFDLETGKNEIGLQQKVYKMKYEAGFIYIRYHSELSVAPCRKPSETSGVPVIHTPPRTVRGRAPRKESILENVMKL